MILKSEDVCENHNNFSQTLEGFGCLDGVVSLSFLLAEASCLHALPPIQHYTTCPPFSPNMGPY
jgi:hypothetical protein